MDVTRRPGVKEHPAEFGVAVRGGEHERCAAARPALEWKTCSVAGGRREEHSDALGVPVLACKMEAALGEAALGPIVVLPASCAALRAASRAASRAAFRVASRAASRVASRAAACAAAAIARQRGTRGGGGAGTGSDLDGLDDDVIEACAVLDEHLESLRLASLAGAEQWRVARERTLGDAGALLEELGHDIGVPLPRGDVECGATRRVDCIDVLNARVDELLDLVRIVLLGGGLKEHLYERLLIVPHGGLGLQKHLLRFRPQPPQRL